MHFSSFIFLLFVTQAKVEKEWRPTSFVLLRCQCEILIPLSSLYEKKKKVIRLTPLPATYVRKDIFFSGKNNELCTLCNAQRGKLIFARFLSPLMTKKLTKNRLQYFATAGRRML